MDERPKSGGCFEAIGAVVGAAIGSALGALMIRTAYAYGPIATTFAVIVSVVLFFLVMGGCAVLGNCIRI